MCLLNRATGLQSEDAVAAGIAFFSRLYTIQTSAQTGHGSVDVLTALQETGHCQAGSSHKGLAKPRGHPLSRRRQAHATRAFEARWRSWPVALPQLPQLAWLPQPGSSRNGTGTDPLPSAQHMRAKSLNCSFAARRGRGIRWPPACPRSALSAERGAPKASPSETCEGEHR